MEIVVAYIYHQHFLNNQVNSCPIGIQVCGSVEPELTS